MNTVAFVLIGFAATIGQILVLRELLTVFSGSELAVAIVLAAWLFWTGLGGILGGKISHYHPNNLVLFGHLQNATGLILTATIFSIRIARSLLQIGAGELVSLAQMLAISFFTLAPFCLLSGSLFSLACSLLAVSIPSWTRSPGLVYFLEGIGAGLGGLLFTLLLIHHFSGIQIAAAVALLLCLCGFAVAVSAGYRLWLHCAVMLVSFLCLLLVHYHSEHLDSRSRQWQWSGFHLIDSEETIFGHIVVVEKENQVSFFETGLWNFTVPDQLSAEEAVHYALLQHPKPHSVLLIGGGVSESLGEILKHPSVGKIEYVELDPELIHLGKIHLPTAVTRALQDPRVSVHHQDGRLYLSRSSHPYDVILLNLPEPFTAQINRFYTKEFFQLAAGRMHQEGVFFFTASAAETALGPTQAKYLKLLYETALDVFSKVIVFPGQTARFFCSNCATALTSHPEVLVERLQQRRLDLLYVQDHYMLWDLSPLRQQTFMAMINQAGKRQINSDLNLKAYAYNQSIWGSQYSHTVGKMFSGASGRTIWAALVSLGSIVIIISLGRRFRWDPSRMPTVAVLYAVAIFGFTEISLEILIVLSFQVFFGYIYYKIGLLLALFMVGLAGGSITFSYYPKTVRLQISALITCQFMLACFCFGLASVIVLFHSHPGLNHDHFLYEEAFSLMSLVAGFIGGTHFPLANRLLLQDRIGVGSTAGLIYGIELLGAFLGCLMVGLVFIPAVGILQTLFVLAVVNLMATIPLILSSWPANLQLGTKQ
jgi:spermidine synthase